MFHRSPFARHKHRYRIPGFECRHERRAEYAMTQPPEISDSDFERLKDHVRLLHGLEKRADAPPRKTVASRRRQSVALFPQPTEPTTTMSPCLAAVAAAAGVDLGLDATPSAADAELAALRPRLNKTYLFRRQCVQKRLDNLRRSDGMAVREAQRIHELNLQPKQNDYFRLNKAFHMRWKNIRGLPVVHSHFRHTYLDTGKPPFVVPVHYKPFNVYWDADYAKQEFIFLDAASEEKKKVEKKKEKKAKQEPPTEPSTVEPRRSSSFSKDSILEQQLASEQRQPGQQTPSRQQLPSKQQTPSKEQSPSKQQPQSGQHLQSGKQPSPVQQQKRDSTSPILGEQPQKHKSSSLLLREQQQKRESSSLLLRERRDRQSTGYEGYPRDSVIEAEQRQNPKIFI